MKDSTISTQKTRTNPTSQTLQEAKAAAQPAPPADDTEPNKKKTFSQRLKVLFKNQVFRYTLLFLGGMILLYLFSMFGGMLTSPGFTYAEF
ncbi:MAG: hypothetical protein LKH14_05530 [Eubacterium sp.]|jgi:hypothetical protein|nr:hypothetical protein [Eubacterium sp.]